MKPTLIFEEKYAAAKSLKNFWTSLASTLGSIHVSLSDHELTVKPHWFLGWLITILALDLRHCIPRSKILSVRKKSDMLFPYKAEIYLDYHDIGGNKQTLILYLRQDETFLSALRKNDG